MATYDSLRRQLRMLESSLDAKLTTYSKLASSIPHAGREQHTGRAQRFPRSPTAQGVLQDYTRDFRCTAQNVRTVLEQANLLSNVRGRIESYTTARSSTTDALLNERGHIDSSNRMADELLQCARDTRAEFRTQSPQLGSVQTCITSVLNSVPRTNNLLGMIQTRRWRDAVVLGALIAVLIIVLWHYMGR
ncbi:hypothetical protein CALVIDRAFT_551395 [Calocera viscosa TUFC12733]|uniref:Golgi SNAP receptor complex member 1 n=1 Tax=Calocera viscosa (strain TUFC12733) TaxID=1330018 RepID=A0A167H307_CALVF|nr:hypothetical protein CALVIDRAFT_551395 [Calocera viscosa TUFC12733]